MEKRTEADILKDLQGYQKSLVTVKQQYQSITDELIEFCNHTRKQITDTTKGNVTGIEVYDGTANGANKIQADGFFGNLCAQSLRWFASALPIRLNWPRWSRNMAKWQGKRLDEIPEVKAWLESVDDILFAAFLRANFYDEMPTLFRDGGSVGCGNMYLEEDIKRARQVFHVLHPREYTIALDASGRVDTEFRTYKLTLKQLREKFGEDALKEDIPDIERMLERNPYEEREITHCMLPRTDFDPTKKDNKNKPYGSYWFFPGGKKLLLESGSQHFRYIHWQYNNGNDGYGYGPGHEAYVEIMLANQQAMSNLIAGQKMVEPPLVHHHSLRGKVHVGPKGRTIVPSMDLRPLPLMENIQLPYAIEMLDRTQKIINEKWHVDFFMMLSQAAFNRLDITATQVMEMVSEKATMLGTVVGRIANDVLNPIIDLMFYAEMDAGRIPPMPQIMLDSGLTDANIEIDYTGPLAKAQKQAHSTQGIRQGLTALAEVAQLYPSAIKKVKWDPTVTRLLLDLNFPASCLTSEEEFAAAIDAENKQVQQAQQMEQVSQMAKAVPGLSKTIEPNSPAEMLVQSATGGEGIQGATQ